MLPAGLVPDASTTPVLGMFMFFLVVVVVRTQVTYWLARVLTERAVTHAAPRNAALRRFQTWLTDGGIDSGVAVIHRWGLVAVPLSFLFAGTKTVINAAAGVTRMPFGRYTAAMLLGCVTHSIIYATVGWAAWAAVVQVVAGSPWALVALVALLAALVALAVVHRRRRRDRRASTRVPGALGAVLGIHEHADVGHGGPGSSCGEPGARASQVPGTGASTAAP